MIFLRIGSKYFSFLVSLGFKELLEVRNIGIFGESGSQSLLWVDKRGEGFKSYVQANDILSFRTEPIAAQIVASIADLRAIEFVSTPLNGPVDRLTSAKLRTNAKNQPATKPTKQAHEAPMKAPSQST